MNMMLGRRGAGGGELVDCAAEPKTDAASAIPAPSLPAIRKRRLLCMTFMMNANSGKAAPARPTKSRGGAARNWLCIRSHLAHCDGECYPAENSRRRHQAPPNPGPRREARGAIAAAAGA